LAGMVGSGLAGIPKSETMLIVPMPAAMVIELGQVFQTEITEAAAKRMIPGLVGSYLWRTPFIYNAIKASTAVEITEAMGWAFVARLDAGMR